MAEHRRVAVGTGGPMGPPASILTKRAAAGERAGFSSMWWADHYMGWLPSSIWTPEIGAVARPGTNPDTFFDPIAAMGAAATATESMAIGTTTDALRRHPVALAQQYLTLQHISGGRAVLGLGAGEGENVLPYGLSFERPVSRMEEAIHVMRLLWDRNDPVDFDGDHFTLRDAVLGLGALDGEPPPIWVMGTGPRMCRITGELGDGWLPVMQFPDEYAERRARIAAVREATGRGGVPFTYGLFAFAVVAPTLEAAERMLEHAYVRGLCLTLPASSYARCGVEHPLGATASGLTDYIPSRVGRDEAMAMIDRVPVDLVRAHVLHGSPDDIRAQLAPYAAAGLDHVVIQNVGPLADPASAREGFALLDSLAPGIEFPAPTEPIGDNLGERSVPAAE